MPFTLSHAAAVVPLARGPLVPAALVVGAMAPDVPYFVKVPRYAGAWYEPLVNATTTHHWPGALTVAVPTAAVLLVVWWVVRAPLVGLVTRHSGDDERARPRGGRLERAWWVLASLAIGVATHVLWDSFTHGDGFLVERVDALREPAFAGMDVARVLQHVSTVVGLVVLTVWAARAWARWRQDGGRVEVSRAGVVVLAGVAALGLAAAGLAVSRGVAQGDSVEGVLVRLVTTSGAAVVAALVLYAVARRVSDRTVAASRVRAGSGRG